MTFHIDHYTVHIPRRGPSSLLVAWLRIDVSY